MQKIKRLFPNIVEAPFPRRLGALFIDIVVSLLIGVLAYMAMDAIYFSTAHGVNAARNLKDVRIASNLYYVVGQDQDLVVYESDINEGHNEEYYLAQLEAFYLDAKDPHTGEALFTYRNSTYYIENVEFNYYVMVLNKGKNDTKFDFVELEGDRFMVSFKEGVSPATRQEEWVRIYNKAIKDLENSNAYRTANKPMRDLLIYGGAGALAIGALTPMLVIPLLFGHGQTLGKYMCGLALVTKEGYKVGKKHVILRYLVLAFLELGASIPLYGIPLFLASASVTVSRGSRALHDHVAGTYVVDARASKIFNNKKDEEAFFNESHSASSRVKINFYQMPEKTSKAK